MNGTAPSTVYALGPITPSTESAWYRKRPSTSPSADLGKRMQRRIDGVFETGIVGATAITSGACGEGYAPFRLRTDALLNTTVQKNSSRCGWSVAN